MTSTSQDVPAGRHAVVVVDVQRALVEGEDAVVDAEGLLARLTCLLDRARTHAVPVVHLRDAGVHDRLIRKGTPGWELALTVGPGESVLDKEADDGFEGTGLESVLQGHDVDRLVVVGIQSEMCVAATCRGALCRGFRVILPRDGHTTYDVPGDDRGGVAVPAVHVARVAEWSLGDRVAAPVSVDDVRF